MKLIINPKGGFSGDMFISGLISLGADYDKLKEILIYSGNLIGDIDIDKIITKDGSTRIILDLKPSKDYIKGQEASTLLEEIYVHFNIEEKYRNFGRTILNTLMEAEKKAHSENVFHSDHYHLHPIGKIHSNVKFEDKNCYAIEIFDKFSLGLKEIENFSHLFVITYLDQSIGYSLNVTPPWEDKDIKVGVFSSRSPNRPNPIGLNMVELYKKEKNILYTQPFDIYDKTPVIDIKPVIKSIDKNEEANEGWITSDKHLDFHKKGIPHKHDNEDSYLHEAQDIIIDISGAVMGMQLLNIDTNAILTESLSVGNGEIVFSHGKLSVPAPATKNILNKYKIPFTMGPVDKELCTPTGASILAALNHKSEHDFLKNNKTKTQGASRGTKDYQIPPLKMYLV